MYRRAILTLFVVITLGPLLLGMGYSLAYSLGWVGLMNDGFTTEHWQRWAESGDAWSTLAYSLYLTLVSLVLTLLLALSLAWRYLGRPTGRSYGTLFLPLLFPPLIAGFAWYYLLSPAGILSRIAYHAGLTASLEAFPRWVNDSGSIGILVTHVFLVFPIFTLLFIEQAKKENMPQLRHMSNTLGGNARQFFRRIYAPLVLQKSKPVIWLYGIFLFGTYEVPLLLGRSTPRPVTVFITEKLTKYNLFDIPVGHAMAVVYTACILILISLFIRRKTITLF